MRRLIFMVLIAKSLTACAQDYSNRLVVGEDVAKKVLKESLTDSSVHNVISSEKLILKDKELAIKVAEPILFSIYGRSDIKGERPYESYLIDNYWIIKGTLPRGYSGGTFLIILDATNSGIIRVTHGK